MNLEICMRATLIPVGKSDTLKDLYNIRFGQSLYLYRVTAATKGYDCFMHHQIIARSSTQAISAVKHLYPEHEWSIGASRERVHLKGNINGIQDSSAS